MAGALVANAFNIVVSYYSLQNQQKDMSMASFIFWIDCLMFAILVPTTALLEGTSVTNWLAGASFLQVLWVITVASLGGFRGYSSKTLLRYCLPLTKASVDVFCKIATITISIPLFSAYASVNIGFILGATTAILGYFIYTLGKNQGLSGFFAPAGVKPRKGQVQTSLLPKKSPTGLLGGVVSLPEDAASRDGGGDLQAGLLLARSIGPARGEVLPSRVEDNL